MKNIVFFFVNPDQIIDLSNRTIDKYQLPTLSEYKVISLEGGIQTFNLIVRNDLNLNLLGNEAVFILYDSCDTRIILEIINEYLLLNKVNIYAVFHQTPGNAGSLILFFLKNIGLNFKGSVTEHEVVGSVYYKYLIPLIKKFSVGLFNELLLKFPDPVLEEKLILLHECLVPSSIPKNLSPILINAPKGDEYQAAYTAFLKASEGKTDENIFDSDFIDALTKLRISLLGS